MYHSMFHCIAIQGTWLPTSARSSRSGGGFVRWLGRQPMTLTCRHVILFLSLQIRRHHLEFNEHLHSCFGDQRFVQAHSTRISAAFDSSHFRKPCQPVALAGEGRTGLLCCFQILYLQGGASLLWLVYPEIQEQCARTFLCSFLWEDSWKVMNDHAASAQILSQMAV